MSERAGRGVRGLARLLAPAAVVALAAVGCGGRPEVTVEADRTLIVKSNFDFIPEHWQEPGLARLAREEDFARLEAPDEFGRFLALAAWTRRQWEPSRPDPYPLCNAIDILRDIRERRTGGFCGQYAYVLADVLKASGYYGVRYVELHAGADWDDSHFVVEAWSDQHAKWVVLDPDAGVWYAFRDTGVPASAGEVRAALFGGRAVEARPVAAGATADPGKNLAYYANVAVSLRSDLMRHRAPLTVADRLASFLFYRDGHTREVRRQGKAGIPYALVTGRWEDLYFDCNRARVEHRVEPETGQVRLEFFTDASMPNFRAFVASVDGGEWGVLEGNWLVLPPGPARRTVLVAPVNRLGRRGVVTTVTITRR